jgi:hypothetical protein
MLGFGAAMSRSGSSEALRGVLAGAAAAIAGGDQAADPEPELLGLLPPSRNPVGHSEREKVAEQVLAAGRARGAGRPPGAQNLATRDVKEYVRRLFGDPMVESARWLMHTPQSLAIELNCTLAEAFDRLESIRRDLRRYFYAPLASVDEKGNTVVPNFALLIGDRAIGAAGGIAPWMTDPEVRKAIELEHQQDQGVSDTAPGVSHEEKSHDGQ